MGVEMLDKKLNFTRKVHQQGNSLSVGIPAEIADRINLQKGEDMEVVFDEVNQEIKYRKKKKVNLPEGIDMEFLETLGGVLGDYKEALRNLKDR
ncbi:AbrB/MazE/SpoVT family DNA-binding domain-containing protein [Cytobacillus oceanisediminis]|uniref:AbrB/MazE/SpoVT family DNA-binding domain-containing protein n=1 Tax=Cytobacillus oceanisediminis TaxID=665099 RepID=UPI001C214EEF|nr:AbrB/MazE/SpoVT family DNA-binding domain-containing protein [Cytobacillus oceanisediminis]MBU8732488.1 AbrB/MazE/SpoVT family DNA-binding domain-containing protein [Cytobacillus oceanisediminis]